MYLVDKIEELRSFLSGETALDGVKIIAAYPYVYKPTRLKSRVIAISPSRIDAKSTAVDGGGLFGEYSIDFDVFAPYDSGSPCVYNTVESLINCLKNEHIVSVFVSKIKTNNTLMCCFVKCTLTFSGEISFGGGGNE